MGDGFQRIRCGRTAWPQIRKLLQHDRARIVEPDQGAYAVRQPQQRHRSFADPLDEPPGCGRDRGDAARHLCTIVQHNRERVIGYVNIQDVTCCVPLCHHEIVEPHVDNRSALTVDHGCENGACAAQARLRIHADGARPSHCQHDCRDHRGLQLHDPDYTTRVERRTFIK